MFHGYQSSWHPIVIVAWNLKLFRHFFCHIVTAEPRVTATFLTCPGWDLNLVDGERQSVSQGRHIIGAGIDWQDFYEWAQYELLHFVLFQTGGCVECPRNKNGEFWFFLQLKFPIAKDEEMVIYSGSNFEGSILYLFITTRLILSKMSFRREAISRG